MYVYKKISIILISFTISGLALRIFLTDFSLETDARIYFTYAYSIAFDHTYPQTTMQIHNIGWVLLLVPFFKIIGPDQQFLLFFQYVLSIIISTLTIPVSYLFAKRFIAEKYALFVPLLFAVDFRMAQNAGFGITEPLVMLLSLAAYSVKNRMLMFAFAGFACLVRFEAVMIIPVLFLINRDKKMIPYIAIPVIILATLFVINSSIGHADQFVSKVGHEIVMVQYVMAHNYINEILNSVIYMVWAAFPTFVFSVYGMLKKRWIIVALGILCISGLWAYLDAYDTRYFFPMFPFLALASAYTFQRLLKAQVNKFVGIR